MLKRGKNFQKGLVKDHIARYILTFEIPRTLNTNIKNNFNKKVMILKIQTHIENIFNP